ncbi:phosphatidylinositol-glycan biosynthesis class X protein isoform X2 [Takifugu rubripes]|uniref:phosphatidylinositol-glycan biosynthesis class X protein isoform X2 n=1 Tax=Takifugu rubripes TaxID=31033 RepID=UPI00114582E9|nr:phosphatidylinositol-glycan biosynthesis class X protein isoform X2 [Takifugu rubripes]XP_056894182.1 phosphatidylinositol-glycan biosynthesis class X protein isoform X2 [Takifugu flavidus]
MYFLVFLLLFCLPSCQCLNEKEQSEDQCDLLKRSLESSSVLVEITKEGFHRQVETTIELSLGLSTGIQVMLLYRWPRGVYLDPYQIASLRDQRKWQILIDSAIDLELPAHKTQGFVTYVYPIPEGPTPRINVTIPIHGRYHQPSFEGKTSTSVHIEPPDLLLRSAKCTQFSIFEPDDVINAPCTPDNSSTCSWVKGHSQQVQDPVCLHFPVGDGLLLMPVCAGTLLVTMICCVLLSKYMWKHRIS